MTLLAQLGAWAASTEAEVLPEAVRSKAKLCFLDYCGVALRADTFGTRSTRDGADQLVRWLQAEGNGGDSLVLGRSERLSPSAAALMNSYLGQSTSLDDTAVRSMSHPACAVVPAVLAVAPKSGSSGADMIAAIVAGYEVMVRIGRAVMPGLAKRGFHITAMTAPFGAAAAAARLMRLDAGQTAAALGIAGDLGAGMQEALFRSYAAGKLAVGRSTQAGIMAAELAADGMAGAPAFLEGPEGFFRAVSDEIHADLVCAGLGAEFEISEVGFKFHSGCRHWHAAVDGVIELRKRHGLGGEDVETVHVETYGEALRMNIDRPAAGDQARLSTPFAIAQALTGRDLVAGDVFTDEQLFRPDIQALMGRVTHSLNEAYERRYPLEWPVSVEIRTRDGKRFTAERDRPMGEPGVTPAEAVIEKFVGFATPALGEAGAARVLAVMEGLEKAAGPAPLLDALASRPGREDLRRAAE